MSTFEADRTPIYLFEVDDHVYFSHFFDGTDLFDMLVDHYNDDAYRFEVPAEDLEGVRELLTDNWFEPIIVDDISEFCVVQEQYTPHATTLKQSVMHWTRRGYDFFVMKDPLAVDQAVERGGTRIRETDLVLGI